MKLLDAISLVFPPVSLHSLVVLPVTKLKFEQVVQTDCTQRQLISQSETLHPEPTDTADIKQQEDETPQLE